ncbi:DegV family protein [Alkaliphilus hydrothermalis]|uniref:DegV family protein with EDD domain n=1 Tax=Alkaliphilus hydrothermalis TaxID=1482730 RepID=A0ABS2NSI0_9FIRM|nr:DegV family protein [Alkaliphilus hydrothermalis]MBM7615722.1 DegV family protein with EDD domain [Alkaliphilus hydrothermalis]
MGVKILTDSTGYLDESVREELGIKMVSLSVKFEDESFKETEIDNDTFYKKMAEKGVPKSSQPAIGEIIHEMEATAKVGDSLVGVFLSSGLSGTFSTVHMSKNMVLEKYPDAEIKIIDSKSTCMQLGFAAIVAARKAQVGGTFEEVIKVVKDNMNRSRFLFIPHNLEYLEKGGRIGRANALLGNFLKIIPVLTVEEGVTTVLKKVRTKKKAIATMVEEMLTDMKNFGLGEIVVHHINCLQEAKEVAANIKESLSTEIPIVDIGPVIGMHVGPGAIGIAYYTEKDRI